MDFILGFVLTIPFLIGLIVIGLLFNHTEKDGWAIFIMAIIGLLVYHLFVIPSIYLLYASMAYLPIGMIWSLWRWRVHSKQVVSKLEKDRYYTKEKALHDITISNQIVKVVNWVVTWPLSMVSSGLRDIILFVELLVTKFFRNLYVKLAQSSVDEINNMKNKDK